VFPLPTDAAVDGLVMTVGERHIVGQINPRAEARAAYEAAKAAGHVASLLDQERPNTFTQAVTNIEPGAQVVIELSYVETLRYDDGVFEFVFPMVVGPRYMPGSPTGSRGSGWVPAPRECPMPCASARRLRRRGRVPAMTSA
jgi:Ca-activated chloride channel family protein